MTANTFHADTGQPDLRPDSPAYFAVAPDGSRIVAAAKDTVATQAVSAVRVLPRATQR
ncbi:hypothetical protein GCM10010331_70880 [Streptomyces xanthochromogenes]|nr:hypothetical protein GCM10010331_70880 [Streptomyces xanthochromogenes]